MWPYGVISLTQIVIFSHIDPCNCVQAGLLNVWFSCSQYCHDLCKAWSWSCHFPSSGTPVAPGCLPGRVQTHWCDAQTPLSCPCLPLHSFQTHCGCWDISCPFISLGLSAAAKKVLIDFGVLIFFPEGLFRKEFEHLGNPRYFWKVGCIRTFWVLIKLIFPFFASVHNKCKNKYLWNEWILRLLSSQQFNCQAPCSLWNDHLLTPVDTASLFCELP